MRLVPIVTLITLSCYFHVVFSLETVDNPETSRALENANCNTEEIAEFNRCFQKASGTMTADEDACESLGKSWQCFPKCFCDHTQSLQLLTEALKSVMNCTEIPPCGAPALAAPAPAPAPAFALVPAFPLAPLAAPGSPASALRPSAVPVCIAAAVSLVARTGRS